MRKKAALKNVTLLPHQEKFLKKFLENKGVQIAYHSLGSGKTISSIAAMEKLDPKSVLVLTPASLQKNYLQTVENVVSDDKKNRYHVLSYEKFRRNPEKYYNLYKPEALVIDEFHRDKDPKSVSFNAIKQIRPKVKYFLGLTGTTVQNTPNEIFPLLNLATGVNRKLPSNKDFERKFIGVEKVYPKGFFKKIFAKLMGRYGEKKVLKNKELLQKIVKPYVDKNKPDESYLKQFPKVEERNIEVPMTKEQQKKYDYFFKKDLNRLQKWFIKQDIPPKLRDTKTFLTKMIRAREVANSPIPYSKNPKNDISSSGKLIKAYENLKKHLNEDQVNKALIYSNFLKSSLVPYIERLKKDNIPFGVFTSETPKKVKNKIIEDFNTNKLRVLFGSPSATEGLDLKGTTLLQNLDLSWNPAKNKQVKGRVARYKSHINLPEDKRKVIIENYFSTRKPGFFKRLLGKKYEPTIDQYIAHRAKEKELLNEEFDKLFNV